MCFNSFCLGWCYRSGCTRQEERKGWKSIFRLKLDLIRIRSTCQTYFSNVLLGSISPTFYEQLWSLQIPKAQKYSQAVSLFCAFMICGRKMLVKSTPGDSNDLAQNVRPPSYTHFRKSYLNNTWQPCWSLLNLNSDAQL